MANTFPILSNANTFGDWVVTTNGLVQENNTLATNNYTKSTGTLYLNGPTLGLQVANNAVVAGQLQVQGTGSSAYVQNDFRVDRQVSFQNTALSLTTFGQANIGGPLLALSSGNGLTVSNNAVVGGNVSVTGLLTTTGNVVFQNTLSVTANATFANSAIVKNSIITADLQANTSVNTRTLTVVGGAFIDTVQANTSVNTSTLVATNNVYAKFVQANTSVNTALLTVTGSAFVDTLQANTSVNTSTITVSNNVATNNVVSNTIYVTCNVTTANIVATKTIASGNLSAVYNTTSNNAIISSNVSALNIVSSTLYLTGNVNSDLKATANVNANNLNITNTINADNMALTNNVTSALKVTANVAANNLNITNTINADNLALTNNVSSALKVTANISGNNLNITNTINAANFALTGNVSSDLKATANVNANNLNITNIIYAANLALTANVNSDLKATANVNANNLNITNTINAANFALTGNVSSDLKATANVNANNLNITNGINASGSASIGGTATIGGALTAASATISGNFVINGSTVYNSPMFNINLNAATGGTANSEYSVYRPLNITQIVNGGRYQIINNTGTGGAVTNFTSIGASSNANGTIFTATGTLASNPGSIVSSNASLLWYESGNYWSVRDVAVANTYNRILDSSLLSDSTVSTSSSTVATSKAANTVNSFVISSNTAMKAYVDQANTGMASYVVSSNTAMKAYVDQANTGMASYVVSYVTTSNTAMKAYVDQANTGMASYVVASNTAMKAYVDQANTGMASYVVASNTAMKAYVDQANTGMASYVVAANTFLQANDASTLSTARTFATNIGTQANTYSTNYTDTANTYLRTYSANANNITVSVLTSTVLPTSGVTAGTYGGSTQIPVVVVDNKGRVTSAANVSVSTTISLTGNTGTGSVSGGGTLTVVSSNSSWMNVTASGSTFTVVPKDSGVTGGAYGSTSTIPSFTVDSFGRITSASNAGSYAGSLTSGQITTALGYTPIQQGTGTNQGSNAVKIGWGSGAYLNKLALQIDASDFGFTWPISISGAAANTPYSGLTGTVPTWNQNTTGTASNITAYTINQSVGTANSPTFVSLNTSGQINAQGSQTGSASLLTATGSLGSIMVQGVGSANSAFMSFHRPSAYASYFGLDTDNNFTVGGWSAGAAMGSMKVGSFGVGTAASGTAGEIRATNNITAYYSDDRLKTNLGNIPNALDKLMTLNGFYYEANQTAQDLGYKVRREVGLSAQQVQAVLPEIVVPAPIDEKYLTIHYDRVVPLLVEAIKELKAEIELLKKANG